MSIQETVAFASGFFAQIWSFLSGVEVPFMRGVSVAGLMIGLFVAKLGFKLVQRIFGANADVSGTAHSIDYHNKIQKGK